MQKPLVRIVAALLAVLLVVGVGVAAIAPMAGAHGDDGVLAVVSATPSGSSSTITVKLTFEGDGHPVDGATVTAVADDGAGAAIDPVPMTAAGSPGEYTARLEFPSAAVWNVRVTAVSPSATVTLTQDIAGPAST
ncbi:MAG TPA: FixH family protein, partial [Microthrixaceae bacterium]|nr:FixH family protein [Microthrixaceae bacterium]